MEVFRNFNILYCFYGRIWVPLPLGAVIYRLSSSRCYAAKRYLEFDLFKLCTTFNAAN